MLKNKKILVTGGAGFIGSHLVDRLIQEGHKVTILDNLSSTNMEIPEYINNKAEFILGDIRDDNLLKRIILDKNIIFHNASVVGIVHSNYEISHFTDINCNGTAKIFNAIIDAKTRPKFILSASNTTYGEGVYSCDNCGDFHPKIRSTEEVKKYSFEPVCPTCKKAGNAVPTPESTALNCNSVYALTKKFQEELAFNVGALNDFPVIALKYFNVFGPRQSLSNPYTGVSAIFMSRIKNGNIPFLYEDGLQTRDFISVHDVVEANILAMNSEKADNQVFNVGSGKPLAIKSLAEKISCLYEKSTPPNITNDFRKGDIRHCIADTSKIEKVLGWKPKISIEEGLKEIINWANSQKSKDDFDKAHEELRKRGLI